MIMSLQLKELGVRSFYLAIGAFALASCGESSKSPGASEPGASAVPCSDGLVANDFGHCVSDVPYACGWKRNNPGNLKASGSKVGDVVANLNVVDQCSEKVDLWDFSGEYNILWMSAAW